MILVSPLVVPLTLKENVHEDDAWSNQRSRFLCICLYGSILFKVVN